MSERHVRVPVIVSSHIRNVFHEAMNMILRWQLEVLYAHQVDSDSDVDTRSTP